MGWLKQRPDGYPDIDDDYLEQLAQCVGHGTLRELLADGLLEISDRLDAIEALTAGDDRPRLAEAAHGLTGIAGQLGLPRLSLAAAELERAARDQGRIHAAARRVMVLAAPALRALADRIEACTPG